MDQYAGNVLYGKKWTVCGDSFTEGVSGNMIREGRFAGQNIAYPYFIAERNNMEIVKFFKGGRTLAYPADGLFHNSLTDPEGDCYYKDIPEDTDYITIYLGINDSNYILPFTITLIIPIEHINCVVLLKDIQVKARYPCNLVP